MFKPGDPVSVQWAGMPEPAHGHHYTDAYIKTHIFVDFHDGKRPALTPRQFCRAGHRASWWTQDADGKWHSQPETDNE